MELMRNASKEVYLEIEILSIPALCTPFRLDPATIPPGMYHYELRTNPEDWTIPGNVGRHVSEDFFGSVLTASPIDLRPGDQRDLSAEDFIVQGGTEVYTAAQFQDKYLSPPPTRTQAHRRVQPALAR